MKHITSSFLRKFLQVAASRLTGDWVVVGGAVLPLVGRDLRVTLDIDVVGPEDATQADLLVLFEICDELGVPIETVNTAAGFYLRKISNWKKMLVLVKETKHAKIFRPDVNLFLLLKIARLTESDLADCLEFVDFANHQKEVVTSNTKRAIKDALHNEKNISKKQKLTALLKKLG